jgi:tetratricopeptide (TPR) repeat protein
MTDRHWSDVEEAAELLADGQVEEALGELERIAKDDPKNEYAFYFLGNAHYERQEWEKALAGYVRALQIAPRYLGALIGAGHALRMMGRLDQALRTGQEALKLGKDDADAHHLLGLIYFQRGDEAAARAHLQAFLAQNPDIELRVEAEGMLQVLGGQVVPFPGAGDAS